MDLEDLGVEGELGKVHGREESALQIQLVHHVIVVFAEVDALVLVSVGERAVNVPDFHGREPNIVAAHGLIRLPFVITPVRHVRPAHLGARSCHSVLSVISALPSVLACSTVFPRQVKREDGLRVCARACVWRFREKARNGVSSRLQRSLPPRGAAGDWTGPKWTHLELHVLLVNGEQLLEKKTDVDGRRLLRRKTLAHEYIDARSPGPKN